RSAAYVVPTDGSREERAITHDGKDVTSANWTSDNQLRYVIDGQTWTADPAGTSHVLAPTSEPSVGTGRAGRGGRGGGNAASVTTVPSPDGKWVAIVRDKPETKPAPTYASDFEKRHQERFKG